MLTLTSTIIRAHTVPWYGIYIVHTVNYVNTWATNLLSLCLVKQFGLLHECKEKTVLWKTSSEAQLDVQYVSQRMYHSKQNIKDIELMNVQLIYQLSVQCDFEYRFCDLIGYLTLKIWTKNYVNAAWLVGVKYGTILCIPQRTYVYNIYVPGSVLSQWSSTLLECQLHEICAGLLPHFPVREGGIKGGGGRRRGEREREGGREREGERGRERGEKGRERGEGGKRRGRK